MTAPQDPSPAEPPARTCYRHPDREANISCQRCERRICPNCMVPAAVGFQCPSCVKEGSASTRQGRLAYGGLASSDATLVSRTIVGVNLAVFLAVLLLPQGDDLPDVLGLLPETARFLVDGRVETYSGVADGAYHRLLTSMFVHVQFWHVGFNMLALWALGPGLESVLGRARFLALYLLSGLAGSVAVYWLASPVSLTIGASGAIFGVLGALVVLEFKRRGSVAGLVPFLVVSAIISVLPGISWQGHLGGLVGGALLGATLFYAPASRRTLIQGLGLAGFGVLLLGLVALRTVALS